MAKTLLITGATRGIGKAIAERFKQDGFQLVTPGRSELDLGNLDSVKTYLEHYSGPSVDVLVNNAGENTLNVIEKIELSDWQRMLNINLTAAFLLIQKFAPPMAVRKWGRIVNISSVYSAFGRSGRAAYTSSKAGMNGLTITAATELGESGVLVNAICPGFVETEMTRKNNTDEQIRALCELTALKRLADPSEIAEYVYFIGSDKNTFITGQMLMIDGGFSST